MADAGTNLAVGERDSCILVKRGASWARDAVQTRDSCNLN